MRVSDLVPWRGGNLARRSEEDARLFSMRREMNRVFDDFFRGTGLASVGNVMEFTPSINVTENGQAYEISAELPGMSEKDIEVTLDRSGLTIQGEKRDEQQVEEPNYFQRERTYGFFQRRIPLPVERIDQDQVSANYENGLLVVNLPKLESAHSTSRQIEVKND